MITDSQITLPIESTIYDIASFDNTIFLASHAGLYRSIDGAESWQDVYQSWMPDTEVPTLTVQLSPDFANDQTIISGVKGGIVMSQDGGQNWIVHQFRNPPPMVTSIIFSPNFAVDNVVFAGAYEDGMFRSLDGGRSWQAFNFGLFDHNILYLVISPNFIQDQTIYAGTSTGIYKSINGGRLWDSIRSSFDDDAVVSLAISDDGGLYAGTEAKGLFKSSDLGVSWDSIYQTDYAINGIISIAQNYLIIQADDSVRVSNDDGKTWETLVAEDVSTIHINSTHQSLIVVTTEGTMQELHI